MKVEELIIHLPTLSLVVDKKWLLKKRDWAESFIPPRLPWFERVEKDFNILNKHLGTNKLRKCFRSSLQDERVERGQFFIFD